ncbi:WG repeat-containing protein [Flavobacterium sp.]|uniref:WG repeat-containing protein n=1 Tax=Flavobacterium sp. TaxID=239 RepID=UPI002607A188|nr:WG repeat-containing protein [Flavobacterium sp.]
MKKIFMLLVLLITSNQFAQTKLTYDKNGILNKVDYDKLITTKKYQLISAFDTVSMKPLLVYAIYLKNNKFGILDNNAKEITPAIYDGIEGLNISYTTVMFGFHENYPVKIGKKYGLISNTGKQILPVQYDYIHNEEKKSVKRFHKKEVVIDSVVVANLGDEELIFTPKGKLLKKNIETENNDAPVIEESRDYSYSRDNYDEKPSVKETTPYGNVYQKLDNNLALVQNKVDKFYFQGLVDLSTNKLLIPVEFNYITNPEKGKFITVKDKKFNFYNEKGELLLPETYENIDKFNKIYRLKKNGKLAIFDLDLKPLTDFIYDEFSSASIDFMVAKKDKKFGVIAPKDGSEIIPFEYENIEPYFNRYETGIAFYKVKLNAKEGFYSKEGKALTEIIYESIVPECTIEEPSLYGEMTMPIDHDYHNKNAYFIYKKDNKYGLLDNDFKNLIPNEYDYLQKSYHNDFVFVTRKNSEKKTNNVSAILNIRTNKTIVDFNYNYFKYFGGNYFMISQDNKLGVCNFDGEIIIPMSVVSNYDERFYYNKIYKGLEIIDKRKDSYYIDSQKNMLLISDK